jgi:hypothetical protein
MPQATLAFNNIQNCQRGFTGYPDRQKTFLLGSRAVVSGWNFEAVPPILPPVATGAQTISIGDF